MIPQPTAADAHHVLAVQQLAGWYADAVSRGDVRAAVQAYTENGVLETPTTDPARGREAIERLVTATTAGLELVFQTVHTGLVSVRGALATARFPITEWARRRDDGQALLFLGWYEDEAVLLDEGWRFARRRLVPRTLGKPDFLSGRLQPVEALALIV